MHHWCRQWGHGACCPPATSAPEPGSTVPLAPTLFGASLFLECFAEPRTVVSVGISVPSCFGKSHLIGGMGGRGWVSVFFFFLLSGEEELYPK